MAGASATASAAACAKRLLLPTTKVSNVYFGFKVGFEYPTLLSGIVVSDSISSGISSFETIENLKFYM